MTTSLGKNLDKYDQALLSDWLWNMRESVVLQRLGHICLFSMKPQAVR